MAQVTASGSRWSLVFYNTDPINIGFSNSGHTQYRIFDIYSNIVSSGTMNTTDKGLTPATPVAGWKNGWYFLQTSGTSNYTVAPFTIANNDGRFVSIPSASAATQGADPLSDNHDDVGLYTAIGAGRQTIAGNNTTAQTNITNALATLNFTNTYVNSDPVRKVNYMPAWDTPSVDGINMGNLTLYRRGTFTDQAWVTLASGTLSQPNAKLYSIQVFNANTSGTVEFHDNLTSATAIQSIVNSNTSGTLYCWNATAANPTLGTSFLDNTTQARTFAIVSSTVNHNAAGFVNYEGPYNEPNSGDPVASAAFISAVRTASSNARAVTPSYLGASGFTTTNSTTVNIRNWVNAMNTIGVRPDGVSFHPYNIADAGDLAAMDLGLSRMTLAVRGVWPGMPLYCTEFGERCASEFKTVHPFRLAQIVGAIYSVFEAYDIQKENFYWFYPTSHGFNFPSWWKNGFNTLMPHWIVLRNMSERIYGMTFERRTTFPDPLSKMFLDIRWKDGSNRSYLFMPTGMPSAIYTLSVTGASTLDVYDYAGNHSVVNVTNNTVTLTVDGLGTWITAPVNVSIRITDINSGLLTLSKNLSDPTNTSVTVTSSSSLAQYSNPTSSNPGVKVLNGSDLGVGDRTGIGFSPWTDTPYSPALHTAVPSTLTFTYLNPTKIDRAIILCPPAYSDGQRNSLISFTIDYQAPGSSTWVNCYSETNPSATSDMFYGGTWNAGSGIIWSFLDKWDGKYQFDCPFTTGLITVKAIRIVALTTSHGQSPESVTGDADGNSWGMSPPYPQFFQCRFVGFYHATPSFPTVLV